MKENVDTKSEDSGMSVQREQSGRVPSYYAHPKARLNDSQFPLEIYQIRG